jgi:hypothetical protein
LAEFEANEDVNLILVLKVPPEIELILVLGFQETRSEDLSVPFSGEY